MSEFEAKDGKTYREVNGSYYEITGADRHRQMQEGGRSVAGQMDRNPYTVDDTKLVEGPALKGVQEGREWGGPAGGYECDSPGYRAKHMPGQRGTDGEPVLHAGSDNHPLNNRAQYQPKVTPGYTQEELNKKWAAEDAEAAEKANKQ